MEKQANYTALNNFSKELGLNFFGVADISGVKSDFTLSKDVIAKVDRAIVIGTRLSAAVLGRDPSGADQVVFPSLQNGEHISGSVRVQDR